MDRIRLGRVVERLDRAGAHDGVAYVVDFLDQRQLHAHRRWTLCLISREFVKCHLKTFGLWLWGLAPNDEAPVAAADRGLV